VIEVMDTVKILTLAHRMLPLLLIAAIIPTPAATARAGVHEITATARGRALLAEAAERGRELGTRARTSALRVWELRPGDYFLAKRLPLNLRLEVQRDQTNGAWLSVVSFDVTAQAPRARVASAQIAAAGPSWWWLDEYCFARMTTTAGWIDSCYNLYGMVNETDTRDFYSLNHFAMFGAADRTDKAVYSAFVQSARASTSASMSWIDWKPRSSISGPCQVVPLSVSAKSVSLSFSGFMCEQWTPYKSSTAGNFKTSWSCGCFIGFGVRYPHTRQAEYAQVVSVPGGGVPRWTLSHGIHAS
jgi:hypothetical protein